MSKNKKPLVNATGKEAIKIVKDDDNKIKETSIETPLTTSNSNLLNQPYSELNNFIQYSIGDAVQSFIDYDDKGNMNYRNGIVRYGYNNKDKAIRGKNNAEIVVLNAFSTEEAETIKGNIQEELDTIYKPISQIKEIETTDGKIKSTNFRILLKKIELFFVEALYNSHTPFANPTITIKDSELAKVFKMDRANLNREMNKILIALSQIQIRSFKWAKPMYSDRNGKKEEIPNLAVVNLIQDAVHVNGETQITFNDKFANHVLLCSVLQTPKELYQVKDALTFDLILYLYGQVREKPNNTFKIKVKTIYETIKQIPRYENVKDRHYQREIYKPVEDAMELLGNEDAKGLGLANINYENTDFIKSNGQYDFEAWLNTNLIVHIIQAPMLDTLRDGREQHKRLAEKNKK